MIVEIHLKKVYHIPRTQKPYQVIPGLNETRKRGTKDHDLHTENTLP